ncbi:hypothetical protein [Massilia sp. TWR1-2-2]
MESASRRRDICDRAVVATYAVLRVADRLRTKEKLLACARGAA